MADSKDYSFLENRFARLIDSINSADTTDELKQLCGSANELYHYRYDSQSDSTNLLQGIANTMVHRVLTLAGIPVDSYVYQWWGWMSWYKTTEHYRQLTYRYRSLSYERGIDCTDDQWDFYVNSFRNVIFQAKCNVMLSNTPGDVLYHHDNAAKILVDHDRSFCQRIAALSGSDVGDLSHFIALRIFDLDDLVDEARIMLNWVYGYQHTPRYKGLNRNQVKRILLTLQGSEVDKFVCAGCGRSYMHSEATLDHVVPSSAGGRDYIDNHILLCKECNQLKGDTFTYRGLRRKRSISLSPELPKQAESVFKRVQTKTNWICNNWYSAEVRAFLLSLGISL